MNGFRETALRTNARTDGRDSLGLFSANRRETKKLLDHFPQILTYDVILAPKIGQNDPILTIFTKNDLF